ncbi:MFS transporter [Microcoleus sp. FACHB-1515]|uniref:MFS transporter n=1 Tax=Cyanophyceae TaxID=3028117 RepID=UPI001688FC93|nr:MFS transporter [Microcoleus sp. FACHB-1515]MBD2090713.1 MFS transporter [Microcoleus sp. FACHB-1515]
MFQTMLNAALPLQFLATAVVAEPARPEDASLVFSGPRFWIAVISGILLAFAFQIVLTNLSVATGISILGKSSDHDDHDDHKSGSFGSTVKKIGAAVGIWTLVTVTLALFFACYLAVKLSLLSDDGLGAIVGLVIWAGYYCLLVFFSSTTVGSLIGSVVNSATSGFQAILGTATAALGGRAASNQVVATAEAAAAAVRRELVPNVDPGRVRDTIEDYIDRIRPADLDIASIRREFESILSDPEVRSMVGPQGVQVDRQKFVDLVSSRTDLSKRDVDRIAAQLESVWQQTLGRTQPGQEPKPDQMTQLIDYLRSTQEGQIDSKEVSNKLDQLIAEIRNSRQTEQQSDEQQNKSRSRLQAIQANVMPIVGMLMGRTDLSDLSVEKIVGQLKSAQTTVGDQANKIAAQVSDEPVSTVRADIENYLHNAYFWELSRDAIDREFREVIYDPAADPRAVREQLERINRSDFVSILSDRGMFTQARIQEIADQLESIRREVITTARAAEERQAALELRQMVETYLTLTPVDRFYPEEIQRAFGAILSDAEADHDTLTLRLAAYDRATLREILSRRSDIAPAQVDPILDALEQTRDRVLFESQNLADQAKQRTEATWTKLQDYLRNTGKDELNPDAIRNELQLLLNDPQAGMAALRNRASHFDRDTLVQLLNQRQDLSEDQINDVLNQVEGSWYRVTHAPQQLTAAAKDQYDQVTSSLSDYLRNTGKDELNPEGIQRDLNLLFNDPQAGMYALRRRLSQVDRDTLVKLLSQRQDLSEEQVNQVIDQVQENIRRITGAPRRLALRTQQRVMDFETAIEQYLRNTDKEELDPEGIKRDLQLLARDPRLGMSNLGQRLSRFDRNTIVALLSQRPDMTPEEAERVVAQIESQRDRILLQLQDVQYRIQGAIDNIFARIRRYLNSLERPELNYDSIKADLRTMMDDPQAGFDALRHRLGQFDRNTLVALLSSRRDISEADANRLIDQVETARTSVLQRAERIQLETQRRLEDVKRQAQKQAEDTRKAAATAAWWLFATAVVSAIASAVAGAIAV